MEQTRATRQYLVTIDRVNHNTFANATDPQHDVIVRLTLDFLRAWLLDDHASRAWFEQPGSAAVDQERLVLEKK